MRTCQRPDSGWRPTGRRRQHRGRTAANASGNLNRGHHWPCPGGWRRQHQGRNASGNGGHHWPCPGPGRTDSETPGPGAGPTGTELRPGAATLAIHASGQPQRPTRTRTLRSPAEPDSPDSELPQSDSPGDSPGGGGRFHGDRLREVRTRREGAAGIGELDLQVDLRGCCCAWGLSPAHHDPWIMMGQRQPGPERA